MSSVNIASHLSAMAARRPNDIAIYCATGGNPGDRDSYDRMTYAELDQRSDEIAAGRLQVVLPGWASPSRAVQLVYPKTRHPSPRVRKVIQFFLERAQERRFDG
jgi:acyl-CoA synthetase (AMP-forming)/AMP-acid ligase II